MSVPRIELPQLKVVTTRASARWDGESSAAGDTSNIGTTRSRDYTGRSQFRSTDPRVIVKDMVVVFTEEGGSHCLRHRLDFATPRTQEAASKAGLTFKDCVMRGNADERIAQLTYERHCLRVQDNVKEISVLRKEISIDPRNAYGEVRKNRELDAGEHGRMQTKMEKIVPGHFPNPIRALLSPEDQSVDPKTVLGPEERAEMKNFISRAWKELRLVMDDQRREERKKERSPGNSSSKGSRRPSPRNEAAGSSVGKNNRESENEKEGSRAGSGSDKEKSSARKDASHMSKTDGFDLTSQITERLKGRKQIEERIKQEELRKLERQQVLELEWKQEQSQLQSIEDRLGKVEMQVTKRNNLKVCNAARSSSNSTAFFAQACLVGSIKQRAQNQSKERISRVMGSYIRKTDRIEQSKRKRESQMLALQERHKKALIDHKQRQGEMLEQQKKEDVKALQDYARQLEDRDKKTRQLIERATSEGKRYWHEMLRVKERMLQENREILQRRAEHRRLLVWDTHRNLHEKNERKQSGYQTQQCFVRTQSICNRKGKENTFQFINLLMRMDMNKRAEREKLVGALQFLNKKLDFGLKLRLPSPNPAADTLEPQ